MAATECIEVAATQPKLTKPPPCSEGACPPLAVATFSFDEDFFKSWRNRDLPAAAAEKVHESYKRHIDGPCEIELEEFMQEVERDLEDVRQHEDHHIRCDCPDHS